MMENNMLATLAGVLLSLAFGYVPGLRDWYGAQDGIRKAQVMAAALLLAGAGVYVTSCYTPFTAVTCDEAGFWELVEMFIAALIANQATFLIAVAPKAQD